VTVLRGINHNTGRGISWHHTGIIFLFLLLLLLFGGEGGVLLFSSWWEKKHCVSLDMVCDDSVTEPSFRLLDHDSSVA
jgi:hypothetical protein